MKSRLQEFLLTRSPAIADLILRWRDGSAEHRNAIKNLHQEIKDAGRPPLNRHGGAPALFFSFGAMSTARIERVLMEAFNHNGVPSEVLVGAEPFARDRMSILGAARSHYTPNLNAVSPADMSWARGQLDKSRTNGGPLTITDTDVGCGRFAVSTLMRRLRLGDFDFFDPEIEKPLLLALARSHRALRWARRMLDRVKPSYIVMIDRGYTPFGECFDLALSRGVPVIIWNAAHRNGVIVLKRYARRNTLDHYHSLSDKSWNLIRSMEWGEPQEIKTRHELTHGYESGEWYGEVGTQLFTNKKTSDEIRTILSLDKNKKTVLVMPHLFWDATFFWGVDVFRNYQDWFEHVVRIALERTDVNWLIKIHPSNIVKNIRDGFNGSLSELDVIRKLTGAAPDHFRILMPETEIRTDQLLAVTDVCLTVRGTIGLEAAARGVRVITAGTGRYDGRGFTIDPGGVEEYEAALAGLTNLPKMTDGEIELARRFAYGVFHLRPTWLNSVTFEYGRDRAASLDTRFTVNPGSGGETPDWRRIADWIASGDEDFLSPVEPAAPARPEDMS